jgi:hypothetical protein
LELVNYQNAQIILIGARGGRDMIKKEVGIEIKEELSSVDNFQAESTKGTSSAKTDNQRKIGIGKLKRRR